MLNERLLSSATSGQVVRYLLVGVWNTLFGYGLYALLTYLFTPLIPYAYMVAGLLGSVTSITVAFVGYKLFVFRTKGNILKEYLRCYVVYGTSTVVNLALLPVLVAVLNLCVESPVYSPYIAGAILTGATVIMSFFGHQQYTFARPSSPRGAAVSSRVWP
jgi:putative flippase GtrA